MNPDQRAEFLEKDTELESAHSVAATAAKSTSIAMLYTVFQIGFAIVAMVWSNSIHRVSVSLAVFSSYWETTWHLGSWLGSLLSIFFALINEANFMVGICSHFCSCTGFGDCAGDLMLIVILSSGFVVAQHIGSINFLSQEDPKVH
eukprot:Gb_17812 [translate_table: standard]